MLQNSGQSQCVAAAELGWDKEAPESELRGSLLQAVGALACSMLCYTADFLSTSAPITPCWASVSPSVQWMGTGV